MNFFFKLMAFSALATNSHAFVVSPLIQSKLRGSATAQQHITTIFNFWQSIGNAFENDKNLSQEDKLAGMLDEAAVADEDADRTFKVQQLTATQQEWRNKMMPSVASDIDLCDETFSFDFYLTGIPNKDPSNDLYGSKTNISSRDRVVGQEIPTDPTISNVEICLKSDNTCSIASDESGFCKEEEMGDWKLSPDGRQLRLRVPVTGFTRTIQTKGTIQKVYWSQEDESSTQTSTVYSIPEGWLYGEAEIKVTNQKNQKQRNLQWVDCVLKVEQSIGLLGAATKMTPCGKFMVASVGRD